MPFFAATLRQGLNSLMSVTTEDIKYRAYFVYQIKMKNNKGNFKITKQLIK